MSHWLLKFEKTRPESKCILIRKGVMITTNLGDDFDPAYILLLTGCDCFFSGKIQTFKLFSFLICLPLYINQICKYCTFESYVWIVLYRLRLATKKNTRKKRGEKKDSKNLKTPKEPCCTVSAFISRPACEWMCHSVMKQYTLQYLHKKEMPSSLVEVADIRSSTSTQKHVLYLV